MAGVHPISACQVRQRAWQKTCGRDAIVHMNNSDSTPLDSTLQHLEYGEAPPSLLNWTAFITRVGLLGSQPGSCTLPSTTVEVDCAWLQSFAQTAMPATRCHGPKTAAFGGPLRISVYGGSVSAGGLYLTIASTLLDLLGVAHTVTNLAMGGSGPQVWLMCPPAERHHVLISEFTLNEQEPDVLSRWYVLARKLADHALVVNLFSWLQPGELTQPFETQTVVGGPWGGGVRRNQATALASDGAGHRLCTIDIAKAALPSWPHRHPLTPRALWPHVPAVTALPCHVYAERANASGMRACRVSEANAMQHGGPAYHSLVAVALVWYLASGPRPQPLTPPPSPAASAASRCYTSLCQPEASVLCPRHQPPDESSPAKPSPAKPSPAKPSPATPRHATPSPATPLGSAGPAPLSALHWHGDFEYGGLWTRTKPSLHAVTANASLRIELPAGVKRVSLGYMEHTVEAEAAIFTVERGRTRPRNISTCKPPCRTHGPSLRTRNFLTLAPERTPPGRATQLLVRVLWLASRRASVEVTDVIFHAAR